MDQSPSASEPDRARITLTPDMRPVGAGPMPANESDPDVKAPTTVRPAPSRRWPLLIGAVGLALSLVALGLSVWTYGEGQREILRLSTELAQLRVSLDLYARNSAGNDGLADMSERLTALEQAARSEAVPMPATVSSAGTTASQNADCLPVGMRLLVATGDIYPICEQTAEVAVSQVENGYITLADGTSVASGGTMPLPGNSGCTLAVTSGGDEGLTGYAEIRVSC